MGFTAKTAGLGEDLSRGLEETFSPSFFRNTSKEKIVLTQGNINHSVLISKEMLQMFSIPCGRIGLAKCTMSKVLLLKAVMKKGKII